jgi:hypothetical protein
VVSPSNIALYGYFGEAMTDAEGKFSFSFPLRKDTELGQYKAYASAEGASASCTFTVISPAAPTPAPTPAPTYIRTNLTIALSSYEVRFGESVLVYGRIAPPLQTSIVIATSQDNIQWSTALTTATNSSGHYSVVWYPPKPGTFYLRAYFYGMGNYIGCASDVTKLTVLKLQSLLRLYPLEQVVALGDSAKFEGYLSPALSTEVTIQISADMLSWTNLMTTMSNSRGNFSFSWTPTATGIFYVRAYWPGDELREEATSSTCEVRVLSLRISLDHNNITAIETVSISGSITPPQTGKVTLELSEDRAIWRAIAEIDIRADGTFSYSYKPSASGTFYIRARYDVVLSNVERLDVRKVSTSISISVSPQEVVLGSAVRISGSITPAVENALVTITFSGPEGTRTVTMTTGSDGSFAVDFTPDKTGAWAAVASWEGNERYSGSSSNIVSFSVTPPVEVTWYLLLAIIALLVLLIIIVVLLRRRKKKPS